MAYANIIYQNTSGFNGIKEYSIKLFAGLRSSGMDVELVPVKRFEIKINGKQYGGWQSMKLLSYVYAYHGNITHATDDWCINRHTNVITVHDLYLYKNKDTLKNASRKQYEKMLNLLSKSGVKTMVQSNIVKEDVLTFNKDADITVIPSAVPKYKGALFNPYPKDTKIHLVTMGALGNTRKRIKDLYNFVKDNPDLTLYHIGHIDVPEYTNYAKNIIQLGQVDENTKYSYLTFADKFVYYTNDEGQGYPTMEAMRCNTQPIINDIPIHRELLGDLPYYFHNKEEFLEMVYKPDKPGLERQISRYDNWINKYIHVYEEIVQKGGLK